MRIRIALVWVLLAAGHLQAQPPDPLWLHTYGGSGDESAWNLAPVHDGGWILVGFTTTYGSGGQDLYLVRLNSEGDTLWTRAVGGTDDDVGTAVLETPDHGFLAVGFTYSFGAGNDDVYLVKTDSVGQVLWTRTHGGAIADEAYDLQSLGNGRYLVAGRTYSFGAGNFDCYLLCIDSLGDTLWTRTYGGAITDGAESLVPTADGGFVLVGYTYSYGAGNYDAFAVKVDSAGNFLWQHTYGGPDDDVGTDAAPTADGGLLMVGYSYTYANGPEDAYLVRIRSDGTQAWSSHLGGAGRDEGHAVARIPGGHYLMAGYTYSYGAGDADAWIVELDTLGTLLGYETFGGSGTDGFLALAGASAPGRVAAAGFQEVGTHAQALAAAFQVGEAVAEGRPAVSGVALRWDPAGKVVLTLPEPSRVTLWAYDVEGRLLGVAYRGFLGRGRHTVTWRPPAPGVFLLRWQEGGRTLKVWRP